MSDIKKIKDEYLVKINNNHNLDNLNQIKSELFGKNGIIALEFKKIGSISANEKKQFASNLNLIVLRKGQMLKMNIIILLH